MTSQTIKQWMTAPAISIAPDTNLLEADELMREHGVRRLPVIKRGKLVGIVTLGDVREARASTANSLSIWELQYLVARLKVEQIMSRDVITVGPDEDIVAAANIMMTKKVSGLPVVNRSGEVVGIITESDIFRMLVTTAQTQRELTTE
jgi:acetoin utilization protein AcuB